MIGLNNSFSLDVLNKLMMYLMNSELISPIVSLEFMISVILSLKFMSSKIVFD